MTTRAELAATQQPLSDEEVVARVRDGDTSLFEVLMRRHNQRLYRAVRSVLRDESEVEDVMQQAYLAAFTHLAQFAGTAKFSTWLVRIGINEALLRLRQRRRLHPVAAVARQDELEETAPPPEDPPMPTPEDRTAGRELGRLLEETVDQLPAAYRQVFMLRLVEGLDTAETAAALDLGEEAVKQRLHRARAMVQQAIEARVGASARAAFEFHAPRCDRVVAAVMAELMARR
jgi:RNA polymerase sigma-70 factor (ECF subfamily)